MTDLAQTLRKAQYSYQELLECAHGRLFGEGNAKLPLPPMLMFDRIVSISESGGRHGKGEIIAELDIKPDLWFFRCHFEGDPVMPGCLGLDALWQLVGFFLGWLDQPGKGRAISTGACTFRGQILPETKLVTFKLDIKRLITRRLRLAIADGLVLADGETVFEAEDLRVGVFSS